MRATANSTIRLRVLDVLLGRVMSLYTGLRRIDTGRRPAHGAIGSTWGVSAARVLGGLLSVAVAALGGWLSLRGRPSEAAGVTAPSGVSG